MDRQRTLTAWVTFVGALAASPAGATESWTCVQAGLVREVTIYYPNAPAPLPCEVFYTKRSENGLPQALWSASNEHGYCARKAAAFVDKLTGLGWQCNAETTATPPAD